MSDTIGGQLLDRRLERIPHPSVDCWVVDRVCRLLDREPLVVFVG